jgi:GNAT superfamily N-acetyltransferase
MHAKISPPPTSLCWGNVNGLQIFHVQGQDAKPFFADMARMRLELFRGFPYLYDGNTQYEQEYLERYFSCPQAHVLLVCVKDTVVGFSTSIPLAHEIPEHRTPYEKCGLDPQDFMYLGEAMLDAPHRGQGVLRLFHELHEQTARENGMRFTTLMTVNRPENHPLRPAEYTPMDVLLDHFGYTKIPHCEINIEWPQVDTGRIESNTLSVWQKDLRR